MHDYDEYEDDNIRLYTPVFQRVIILAAVIIAVPVVMWTITTFVRSYVGRPKVPAIEHVASTTASTATSTASSAPAPAIAAAAPSTAPAPQSASLRTATAAVSDAPNSSPDSKKGAPNLAALSDAPLAPVVLNTRVPAPQSSPATPAAVAGAPGEAANTATASLPRPTALRAADNAAASAADRSIAWPNPNSASPPDFTSSRASPPPPPARVATVEAVPAAETPLGPVPLPRQRPGSLAMTSSVSIPGSVPMPRVRPAAAPAEATTAFDTPAGGRSELENAH
jgi:hypothetical protein